MKNVIKRGPKRNGDGSQGEGKGSIKETTKMGDLPSNMSLVI